MGFLNTIGKGIGSLAGSIFGNRPIAIPKTNTIGSVVSGAKSFGSGVSQGYNYKPNDVSIGSGMFNDLGTQQPAQQLVQQPIQQPVNQGTQQPNAGAYTYSGGVNANGQTLGGYTPPPLNISANQTPDTKQMVDSQNGTATPIESFADTLRASNQNISDLVNRVMAAPAVSPDAQTAMASLSSANQQFNDVTSQIQKLTADAIATQESIQSQPGELASIAEARANVFNNQFRKNIQPLVDQANNLKAQAANYQQQVQFQQTSANDLMTRQISAGNLGINLAQLPIQQATAMANLLKKDTSITEVNGHRVIVDNQTGKVVSDLGIADANKNGTGGIMDSVLDSFLIKGLQDRNVEFNSLPAAEKKAALAAFARQGIPFPRQLTTKEENARPDAISGLEAVQNIERMIEDNGGLPLARASLKPWLARLFGASDYINNAAEATDIKTRIRTGAALNESEIEFYASQAPKIFDSPEDITKKLNQLKGFYLGTAGLPVIITDPATNEEYTFNDLFDFKQRLDMRSLIRDGGIVQY